MTSEQSEYVVEICDDLIADIRKMGDEIGRLDREIQKLPPDVDVSSVVECIDEIGRLLWDIESRAEEIRVEVT